MPEWKIIGCAVDAEVEAVWALHHGDIVSQVTHVPTGRKAFVGSADEAKRVWRELAKKLPRYAEGARFGEQPADVNAQTLLEIITGAITAKS